MLVPGLILEKKLDRYVEPVRGENEGRNVRVKAQKLVDLVFDEDR